jgi:hypothetical protein
MAGPWPRHPHPQQFGSLFDELDHFAGDRILDTVADHGSALCPKLPTLSSEQSGRSRSVRQCPGMDEGSVHAVTLTQDAPIFGSVLRSRCGPDMIGTMPLVDVAFDTRLSRADLARIAEVLRDVVPLAVECPEEPIIGPLAAGDLEIRFRPRGVDDVGELVAVIEVRTKRFSSRQANVQDRADMIRDRLAGLSIGPVGVWLVLIEGGWSQAD